MPLMQMNRDFQLVTTAGRVIGFKKDEPIEVPRHLYQMALTYGAIAVDEENKVELEVKKAPSAPTEADVRAEQIIEKMKEMMARNLRGDFTASGHPNVKALERLLGEGWSIDVQERDLCWAKLQHELSMDGRVASNES